MMVVIFRHVGTTALLREMLKMSVKTPASCSAHSLSTLPGMLSGPAAFRGLTLHRVFLKSAVVRQSTWSSSDPVGQEVIWALGAGCRDITSLNIAPLQPCQQPNRFSNRCLQTIGRCWPHLHQVGVGGTSCGLQGLTSLVRNCSSVCVLELDHMSEISQQGAAELCREGLQQLHTLIFSYTPVTAKAILHFHSVCLRLKCIIVLMSYADYFDDPESEEAKRIFNEMISSLQALKKRPGLTDILQVRVDQCDILAGS
ncbi:hypothetical protein QTP86_028811 [Hemibagrus guttatus]|nr:hypothetical protein QTP86_028811 [Hemibagrus guttatus]